MRSSPRCFMLCRSHALVLDCLHFLCILTLLTPSLHARQCCREMEWSFKQTAIALPPWREERAALTRWQQPPACSPRAAATPATPAASASSPPACHCSSDAAAHGGHTPLGRCASQLCQSPSSVLAQRAALMACGTSTAPTSPTYSACGDLLPRRTSLLSRSLEAAGLRRSTSTPPGSSPPAGCWAGSPRTGAASGISSMSWVDSEPRIHIVRRTA